MTRASVEHRIPDVEGTPVSTVEELLERAESQRGRKIAYRLGGGAARAVRDTCADAANTCDCSAFVCWALGIDKQGSYPYLVPPGKPVDPGNQWYGTDNIWNDAVHLQVGFFQRISEPAPGCVVVFPARRRPDGKSAPGHIGLVVRVGTQGVESVLHCSSSNFKATGDGIQETDDTVFRNRPGLIYAWCARIAPPPPSGTRRALPARTHAALSKPVTLCVLAGGREGANIRRVAEAVAAENPLGRRVVLQGDTSCPTEEILAASPGKASGRGAAILSPEGSLTEVLGVARARRGTAVDLAFLSAATGSRVRRREARRRPRKPQRRD